MVYVNICGMVRVKTKTIIIVIIIIIIIIMRKINKYNTVL